MQQMIFITDLIASSTCFGHHYAHYQEVECIIQVVAACRILVLWFSSCRYSVELKTKAPNTTGSNHLYNTLEFLMMGIMVPETCWASNKICNKNHLLHLVGILFLHIKDDALSKSLQRLSVLYKLCNKWISIVIVIIIIVAVVLLSS